MNEEIYKLVDAIEVVLTNPISVFFIALVSTLLNFEFLKKVPAKMKTEGKKERILFGVINGIILGLVCPFVDVLSPIWFMLLTPLILVLELAAISEDTANTGPVIEHVTTGTTSASLTNGSAASNGAHTHNVKPLAAKKHSS